MTAESKSKQHKKEEHPKLMEDADLKKKKAAPKKAAAPKKSKSKAKSGSKVSKPKSKSKRDGSKKRSFKRIDPATNKTHGRYTGDPRQAASKAFTKLLSSSKKAKRKISEKEPTKIYLKESTRGGSRKIYAYDALPVKLAEPQEFTVEDKKEPGVSKTYVRTFRNKITRVKVPEAFAKQHVKPKKSGEKKKKSGSKVSKPKAPKKSKAGKSKKSAKKSTKK